MRACLKFTAFLFSLLTIASSAQARLFNIANEKFASYLSMGGGSSSIQKTPFADETTANLSYDEGFSSILGGEFGFLYATPVMNFRFGIGVIKPSALEAKATNASRQHQYTVKSDLLGFVPKVGIELNFKKAGNYRIFGVGSAGLANITMTNDYALTSAGQTTFAGVVDHTVSAKGNATELYAAVGGEVHLTDTTTFLAEAGYRSLTFTKLTYSKDVTTFTGNKKSGDTVLDAQGRQRSLDFSGVLLSAGLRFYL